MVFKGQPIMHLGALYLVNMSCSCSDLIWFNLGNQSPFFVNNSGLAHLTSPQCHLWLAPVPYRLPPFCFRLWPTPFLSTGLLAPPQRFTSNSTFCQGSLKRDISSGLNLSQCMRGVISWVSWVFVLISLTRLLKRQSQRHKLRLLL